MRVTIGVFGSLPTFDLVFLILSRICRCLIFIFWQCFWRLPLSLYRNCWTILQSIQLVTVRWRFYPSLFSYTAWPIAWVAGMAGYGYWTRLWLTPTGPAISATIKAYASRFSTHLRFCTSYTETAPAFAGHTLDLFIGAWVWKLDGRYRLSIFCGFLKWTLKLWCNKYRWGTTFEDLMIVGDCSSALDFRTFWGCDTRGTRYNLRASIMQYKSFTCWKSWVLPMCQQTIACVCDIL